MTDLLLDAAGAAARLGVLPATVLSYRSRGVFPPPDVTLGQSPGWYPQTIDAWQASRPGRTGRPKKEQQQ